jgi:hypothetical protein
MNMVHGVSECFPTSEPKQKEIKITRETKNKNKKKNSQLPGVLECSFCLEVWPITQVGALDHTQDRTAK